MEPCEGLDLPRGCLIQLVAPVYGLNDAPLRWHRTMTGWLVKQGFGRDRHLLASIPATQLRQQGRRSTTQVELLGSDR